LCVICNIRVIIFYEEEILAKIILAHHQHYGDFYHGGMDHRAILLNGLCQMENKISKI
jgi:hypothetical protein